MSLQQSDHKLKVILKAVNEWKEQCLLQSRGVFSGTRTWNFANFEKLYEDFVEHPDASSDKDFFTKLEHQLRNSSDSTIRLTAEMLWFMSLSSINVTPRKKRNNIKKVWEWSGVDFDEDHRLLQDKVLCGYAHTGVSFNTNRWRELTYFINVMLAFFGEKPERRKILLSKGETLAHWLEDIEDTSNRQFRHILLFLLFPKDFERITSNNQRRLIVKAFENISSKQVKKLSCWQIDELLLSIRRRESKRLGRDDIEFYQSPLKEVWYSRDDETKDADEQDAIDEQKVLEDEELRSKEIEQSNISSKNKQQLINARHGHGKYRTNLSSVESRCRVTGITDKRFLTASHIKPWRYCNDSECLDGHNGLWLAPHIDRLFDRGWISFSPRGNLICSNDRVRETLEQWGVKPNTSIGKLSDTQIRYMKYHNEEIFKNASSKK